MRLILSAVLSLLLLGSTMAAAEPAAIWQILDIDSKDTVDHSAWQELLQEHVHAHADGINRIDYTALGAQQPRAKLEQYINALEQVDPRQLNRNEQMAFWINLYNAVTVRVVLDHPGKKSIRRMGARWFRIGPWDDVLTRVLNTELTLNDIEHGLLRPIYQDHRIHYAVNCASLGCPNLLPSPFTGATLDVQLTAAETAYIEHPRGVGFASDGTLRLSSIFDWYQSDFADDESGLLKHLAARLPSLSARLVEHRGTIAYDYDWSLNVHLPDAD